MDHDWFCTICSGPVNSMGVLGRLEHGRCQNCGTDHVRQENGGEILLDELESQQVLEILDRPAKSNPNLVAAIRAAHALGPKT